MQFKKSSIFGFDLIAAQSIAPVVDEIIQLAATGFGGKPSFLITPNAYTTVHYLERKHRHIYNHYRGSAYILPDGAPIVWLSRLLPTVSLPARLTGSDLFPALWDRIKSENYPATLVLPKDNTAALFKENYANCNCFVPKMFDEDDDAYIDAFAEEVADGIIQNNSLFLFLGLNFPKQEKLGIAVGKKLQEKNYANGVLIMLLGASFEFYFGLKKRAPGWIQKAGMEWLHRFITEPKRLWKRYTIDVARFFWLAAKEILYPAAKRKPKPVATGALLKIGILGTRGIPNRYGGFEQCAEYLAPGLAAKGHEVWVYNSHDHEYQGREWYGVHIQHCFDPEYRIGTAGQFIYDLNSIRDARRKNFDVVIQLGYTSSSVWHWLWPRKALNVVNMDGLEWKRSKYSRKVQWFLKKAEGWAVKNADLLISDSIGIRDHIRSTYNKSSVFIPYGANIFDGADSAVTARYGLQPYGYHIIVARLVPENNIEMIIEGVLASSGTTPLLIIGELETGHAHYLEEKYKGNNRVVFGNDIFDEHVISSLRYYARYYFHGHSVGGTNPSLLEAMGCSCIIAANDNIFNRSILGEDGFYFSSASDITTLLDAGHDRSQFTHFIEHNKKKIRDLYNWPRITAMYEQAMYDSL